MSQFKFQTEVWRKEPMYYIQHEDHREYINNSDMERNPGHYADLDLRPFL